MRTSFYIGMAIGTISTTLAFKRDRVAKFVERARKR